MRINQWIKQFKENIPKNLWDYQEFNKKSRKAYLQEENEPPVLNRYTDVLISRVYWAR